MFGVPWKPWPCLLTLTLLVTALLVTVPLCRNVNGLRAVLKKGLPEYVKADKPDVLCLTETKIDDSVTASVRDFVAAFAATPFTIAAAFTRCATCTAVQVAAWLRGALVLLHG